MSESAPIDSVCPATEKSIDDALVAIIVSKPIAAAIVTAIVVVFIL
jgi:hypothetical protein